MWSEGSMSWHENMSHYVLRHTEAICGLKDDELDYNQMPQLYKDKPFE